MVVKDGAERPVKGYKATDRDGCCRPFVYACQKYEAGKEYTLENQTIEMCVRGFHFCRRLYEVFAFYPMKPRGTRVFLVEARGETIIRRRSEFETGKCVTNRIYIERELSLDEIERILMKEGRVKKPWYACVRANSILGEWRSRRMKANE